MGSRSFGGDRTRIFEVAGGGELFASGLTICHGRDVGSQGGRDKGGTATAGAILSRGITRLRSVTVADNSALGGPSEWAEGGDAIGGAITNFGQLTVGLSTFAGNRAVGAAHPGQRSINDRLDGGSASGGAIRNEGSLEIGRTEFRGNAAIGGDGALINTASASPPVTVDLPSAAPSSAAAARGSR